MRLGCGGGRASSSGGTGGRGPGGSGGNSSGGTSLPKFNHAFIVVEENHNYSAVIGCPSMPYLNQFAADDGRPGRNGFTWRGSYRTGHDGILQIAPTEPAQLRHNFSTPRR